MSRAKRIVPLIVVAAILAIVLLPRRPVGPDDPFVASGVVLRSYTDAGDLSWEVEAQSGEVVDEEAILTGVILRFLSSNEVAMTASADQFVQGEETSILSGNVRIEREDELRLRTEEMSWHEREEKLEAGPVELEARDLLVIGDRFEYDLETERATISGAVRADDPSNEETYRCDRIEADEDAVYLSGSVEAEFEDGGLTADRVRIDEDGLTAEGSVSLHFDPAATSEED